MDRNSTSIQFLGADQTVTGSKHLLTLNGKKILVDCGLYQGSSELKARNWLDFPVDPKKIDALILTHAHLDHVGYIPRLVKQGYEGPVYATKATCDLARITLPDSGRLQEEDAYHYNKNGSKHMPALPLYTERDAFTCLKQFVPMEYYKFHGLPGQGQWKFLPAGHILGSAFAEIYFENGERILMSGDLGRFNTPIIKDPTAVEFAEYLTIESTYGDRVHPCEDPMIQLDGILHRAWNEGLTVLVPSFAIGRTQELLYYISALQRSKGLPRIPIYVDSPMATSTTHVYESSKEELDAETRALFESGINPIEPENLHFVRDSNASKALNEQRGPMIVIAGSGMANGGRIVHHLMRRLPEESTIVLFTGYQAEGTLGRNILDGAETVHIFGKEIQVRAKVDRLNALSAHADQAEIIRWLQGFKVPPKQTFIVHGEPVAQLALQKKIESDLGWETSIPSFGDQFDL